MTRKISETMTATDLRQWARRCGNSRALARAYAIANALEGYEPGGNLPGWRDRNVRLCAMQGSATMRKV